MSAVTQLRWSGLVKRLFATKGSDPARDFAPSSVSTYELGDVYRPEDRLMRGDRVWGLNADLGATTIQFSFFMLVNLLTSGKIDVLRRLRFAGLLPTSTNQPGRVFAFCKFPQPAAANGILAGTNPNCTDGRVCGPLGTAPAVVTTGYNLNVTSVAIAAGTFLPTCVWAYELAPGGAAAPFSIVSPDLDVVLSPGMSVQFGLVATSLPAANWNSMVGFDGYERGVDPAELIAPP
jgi:hypothetical protein